MITVDDIVHIIQEEAGEDVLLLSGAGGEDINEPVQLTVRRRLFWLVINLGTAIIAASVVSLFQGEIGKYAVLAVLMLGVHDIITDVEAKRLCSHCSPFHMRQKSPAPKCRPPNTTLLVVGSPASC